MQVFGLEVDLAAAVAPSGGAEKRAEGPAIHSAGDDDSAIDEDAPVIDHAVGLESAVRDDLPT